MINTSTSLFPLVTISQNNSMYYNTSVLVFSMIASINHVLPENLNGITHVVKMLFTNVLFSLININPFYGLIISLVDLSPLFIKGDKSKKLGESLLQMPRLWIEIFLMHRIFYENSLDVMIMIICKIIYYFERKARIKKGVRNDFSSWHAAEHMGLYLLFKDSVNVDFCLKTYATIFFSTFIFLIGLFLHFFNAYLHMVHIKRAPVWVKNSPELMTLLNEKLIQNKTSLKYRNYIIKPWASHLKFEFVTWNAIERICVSIITKITPNDYDVVVGITTGGAFVAKYIAHRLNKPFLTVKSKFWSNINIIQNYRQTIKYLSGIKQIPNLGELPDVSGKRVLLVDDTTYTGITLSGIMNSLLENGKATKVTTAVMWTRGCHSPDFFYTNKRIPIIWEWGAEVD